MAGRIGASGRVPLVRGAWRERWITGGVVIGLIGATTVAAIAVRSPAVGSSCAEDWTRMSAAVRAYRDGGGTNLSLQALLDGAFLAEPSEYFDIDDTGAIVPLGAAPLVCK